MRMQCNEITRPTVGGQGLTLLVAIKEKSDGLFFAGGCVRAANYDGVQNKGPRHAEEAAARRFSKSSWIKGGGLGLFCAILSLGVCVLSSSASSGCTAAAHLARLVKGPITVLKPSPSGSGAAKRTRGGNAHVMQLSLINNYMREGVEPEIYSLLWFQQPRWSKIRNFPKTSSPGAATLFLSFPSSACVFSYANKASWAAAGLLGAKDKACHGGIYDVRKSAFMFLGLVLVERWIYWINKRENV